MLRFRKAKSDAVSGFLGSQTEFTGKLAFSGVVHLDGNFSGEIVSRGTLVVGRDSVVNAQIHSNILKIAGEVRGDLTATEKIELYPPAKVYGNIRTPSLVVEEGVIFEGTCSMSSSGQAVVIDQLEADTSLDDDPLEAISAQAWPPDQDDDSALRVEPTDKSTLIKHDQ
ncbi:bactofilin family protein [Desulfomonile tiedjei]|uniref:Integral membrane protein CcmA involved in cell shape determination n=1 Tax=Desulfomonile tiedjei (strain ATCC 49306 / DSM 6799 / DCB-1) TaxID=706587 RepID=I4C9W5_DESTA|nr:polymer-forming cytoskeletal protein [Desulfomonile tiedjei]AFM26356.1 Integral membrane protein CcmA involved in cell shape determination [Desulfomonile tiedjei DSM 6799]